MRTHFMAPALAGLLAARSSTALAQTTRKAAPAPAPAAAAPAAAPTQPQLRRGVVVVRVTTQDHDYRAPWSKLAPRNRAFTAMVVPGPAILCTAAGLGQETLVEVQRPGEDRRFVARVTRVDHETSLALLSVEDAAFWKDVTPLTLAEDVPAEGEVSLLRWLGNNQFETAGGSVRQLRPGQHGVGRAEVLTLDVATTMANGGAGEVIARDGKVVGLATGRTDGSVSALAAPVLAQFLADARSAKFRGAVRRGLGWQKTVNPALRAHLGLAPDEGGVLVTRVTSHGSGADVLKRGDVLLSVRGTRVDESGQVDHPRYGKQGLGIMFTLGVSPGDTIPVRVLRAGKRMDLQLKAAPLRPEDDRIMAYVADRAPDYAVHGGLVFQPLTLPYLRVFGDWRRRAPLPLSVETDLFLDEPLPGNARVMVLTEVLPDPVNLGFQDDKGLIVESINGQPVGSVADVDKAFGLAPPDGFHVVTFRAGQNIRRMVLDAAELPEADARIRDRYDLGSADH